MKEKERKLLEYLSNQNDWHTAAFLSSRLNISARSIKSYIASINDQYPRTIISSRSGYKIENKDKVFELLEKKDDVAPQNAENRKKYILRQLLIEENKVNLDTLAEKLCISPVTLENELRDVKLSLSNYDLVFKTKRNYAFIEGNEENKKKMISKIIYEESVDGFLSLELIQSYFPAYDLYKIKKILSKELLEHKCFMDDFSLINFILHIAITMQRTEIFSMDEHISKEQNVIVDSFVKTIVSNVCKELSEEYHVQFSRADEYSLSVLMMTRILKNNTNSFSIDNLETIVGPDVHRLFFTIQEKVKDVFNITLNNDDFIIRFCIHIKNMLVRMENDLIIRNPQMAHIKNQYPFIYEVSVYISKIIFDETHIQLSEDEIAYIALHIGVLIEEKNALKSKISILFLCPQYFYNKSNVVDKCMSVFENDILNVGVVTSYDELLQYENYDAIISTIPFRSTLNIPVIMVSSYFTTKDVYSVSKQIESLHKTKVLKKLKKQLTQLFKKELFYVNPDFKNETEAINKMSSDLEKYGYVNSEFTEKLFERERISSSAFGNIAMPHPLNMCANHSVISVSIHQNAIQWNASKVSIVFMLAISDDFRPLFTDVFDFITEIIADDDLLYNLTRVNSYEEFIQYLLHLCN